MKQRCITFVSLFMILLLLTSCGRKGGRGKPTPQTQNQEELKVSVIVEELKKNDLKEYIRTTGKLEGYTDISMASETSGQIVEIKKQLGDWVDKGEEIGRVDNEDYRILVEQAEASVLAAEASFESAKIQMSTADSLLKTKNISKMEYQNYVSAYKQAKSALDGAKANLEKARRSYNNSQFISPVSGYIVNLPIRVGETISMGQPVCGIVNSKKLLIRTGIGESDINKVREGQTVSVYSNLLNKTVDGRIRGLGIKPLPQSSSYPIEIVMDNPKEQLYPGMVVQIKILSNIYEDVLYSSFNNVVSEYNKDYVFIINEDNIAQKVEVELGTKVETNVILKNGLNPGQKLVVEGIDNLEDGTKVEIKQTL